MNLNTTHSSYLTPNSSWVARIDLGTLNIGDSNIELNVVLLTLNNGAQYLYYGLSESAIDEFESRLIRALENGGGKVGNLVNTHLKPLHTCSRLNGSI